MVMNKVFYKVKFVFNIIKSTKNWASIVFNRFSGKTEFKAKFRNGFEFKINKENWPEFMGFVHLFSLLPNAKLKNNSLKFFYKSKNLEFDFGEYGFGTIVEVFGLDEYKKFFKILNPKDKVVVDVGATLGDSSIYFMLNGAKKVYAFEALPGYARLAEKNIIENRFKDSCELIPMAVGGVSGEININSETKDMFGANYTPPLSGDRVQVMTLKQIVEKFNIEDGYLKIDAEGYEYEIIQNTSREVLRKFSDVFLEYHYGYEDLVQYFKRANFEVSYTKPRYHFMPQYKNAASKTMFVGYIFAKRK